MPSGEVSGVGGDGGVDIAAVDDAGVAAFHGAASSCPEVATADKSSACESLREAFPVFEGLAKMLGTQQSIEDLEDVRQRWLKSGELQA